MMSKDVRDFNDAFITEVDIPNRGQHKKRSALLDPVRKEHVKIREVVDAFSAKVELLIDKQRTEYIQAYESHMQDVQRELHTLREKVSDIANDGTKNEKTEKLKADQKKFKNEALKLEIETDEIRKKIRKIVRQIYSVEKTRDWMLKRLRQAKKTYNTLLKERAQVYDDWDSTAGSLASMSNGSTYTLEMTSVPKKTLNTQPKRKKTPPGGISSDPQQRLNVLFAVNRDRILPAITRKDNEAYYGTSNTGAHQQHHQQLYATDGANREMMRGESLPVLPLAQTGPAALGRQLGKSNSGPMLTAGFANSLKLKDSFSTSGKFVAASSRSGKQGSTFPASANHSFVASTTATADTEDSEVALVDCISEQQAVARLVALRTRKREVREFISQCASALHKAPWSRVHKRPLPELLDACERKLQQPSAEKFNDEALLQLACELAAQPATYEVLLDIFDNYAPMAANYRSDEEISSADLPMVPHSPGSDNVTNQLMRQFSSDDAEALLAALSIGVPPAQPEQQQQQQQEGEEEEQSPVGRGEDGGSLLDDDLLQYFKAEKETKRLSTMGLYHDDEFLDFKLSTGGAKARSQRKAV